MKNLHLFFMASLSLAVSCQQKAPKLAKKEKPNIVFVFTDDQTYTSVHALGNKEIITPTMDSFVAGGTTFTHAYNMGSWSGAVCLASRAMINSGRTVWRANEMTKNWKSKDQQAISQTWSKIMEGAGYETYMTGKWHVDAPAKKVFNHTMHIRPGMPKDAWGSHKREARKDNSKVGDQNQRTFKKMPIGYGRPKDKNDKSWNPTDPKFGGYYEGGKHWSEVLKDDAISFIDQAKENDKPFFMYLAFNAPHDPRQAPQEYQDMYDVDKLSLPKSFLPLYPYRNSMGNSKKLRDEALAPFPRTEFAIKTHKKEYYASITHVDAQIGMIIDALKKSGKMDNTYIFFTADHGLAMGRHGLLGKQNMYDHSIRPPLVVIGPDIPKNQKIDADVYLQDIMASAIELSGVEKPAYVEFSSFLDLAKGSRTKSHYEAIYGAYLNVQRMIRKDDYKLIVYPELKKVLLFDLKNDPEEMHDLSSQPEYKVKAKQLFKDLLKLQKDMGDPLDISAVQNVI